MALQDGDRIVRVNKEVRTEDNDQRDAAVQQTINDVVLYLFDIEARMELATSDESRARAQKVRDAKRRELERTLRDRFREIERRASAEAIVRASAEAWEPQPGRLPRRPPT